MQKAGKTGREEKQRQRVWRMEMGFGGRPLAAAARTWVRRAGWEESRAGARHRHQTPDTRHQTLRRVTTCACSQELASEIQRSARAA